MADRIIPEWARWFLLLGLALPATGWFLMKDYNPAAGIWANMMQQNVVVPFLRGSNPFECFNESLRNLTGAKLGYDAHRSQQCSRPTEFHYRHLLYVSLALFLLGLYKHLNPEKISNKWPTEWRVFNPANVKKKPTDKPPEFKNESPNERPIKPEEGGF